MHPIFDSPEYNWSDDNADALYNILKTSVTTKKMVEYHYRRAGAGLPALNSDQSAPLMWQEALDNLAANGTLKAFCEKLRREGKPPALMEVLEKIFKMESVTERKFLQGNSLLDRKKFREKLMALADPNSSKKVLLIRGELQSGKTQGRHLFSDVAVANGGKSIYMVIGMVNSLDEVLKELFAPVGGFKIKRDKEQDSTDEAWYRTICSTLQTAAGGANARLWIAMDSIGHVSKDIRGFFDQLVLLMTNPAYHPYIRLMLIDYPPGDTPTNWDASIWHEDLTTQNDVGVEDVVEGIQSWLKTKGGDLFEDEIKEKAQSIIKEAEEAVLAAPKDKPVSRIKSIDEKLRNYLETIKIAKR